MKKYIVFTNNQQSFALEISFIERIIEFQQPKKIPESSSYLLGVIQYNDNILPVIDLTKRLYDVYSTVGVDDKIIVVSYKDKQIGLVVDEMKGIQSFDDNQFEQSTVNTEIAKEYIQGFIKTSGDITIVLDTNKLFDFEQEEELLLSTSS